MALKERLAAVPFLGTLLALHERYTRDAAGQLAAAIAFFAFLSLFPLVLVALSVAALLVADDPAAQAELTQTLISAVPGLGTALSSSISELSEAPGATGLIGSVLLLYSGLRAIESASVAASRIAGLDLVADAFLRRKVRDLTALAVLGAIALLGVGAGAVAGLDVPGRGPLQALVIIVGLLLSFVLDLVMFLVAYRILVARPGPSWRSVLPGAALCAVGWTGLKLLGSTYVESQVESSDAVYGSLASVVASLVLLYVVGRLYVYGAELNALLKERRDGTTLAAETDAPASALVSAPLGAGAAGRDVSSAVAPRVTVGAGGGEIALPPGYGDPDVAVAGTWRSLRPALALVLAAGAIAGVGRFLGGGR